MAAKYDVDIIRIAEYINEVVATRKIPDGKKGSVVMKLDVEVVLSTLFKNDFLYSNVRVLKLLSWVI